MRGHEDSTSLTGETAPPAPPMSPEPSLGCLHTPAHTHSQPWQPAAIHLGGVARASWVSAHEASPFPGVTSPVVSSPPYYPPQAAQGLFLQPSLPHLFHLMVPMPRPHSFRTAMNHEQVQQPPGLQPTLTHPHVWSAQTCHVHSAHTCSPSSQPTPLSSRAIQAWTTSPAGLSSPLLKVSLSARVGVLSPTLDCGHHESRPLWDSRLEELAWTGGALLGQPGQQAQGEKS